MVKLTKIYTRTGDDGTTGLVGGQRTAKTSLRVCAYGDVDELNAHIGLCQLLAAKEVYEPLSSKLLLIENELFDIGSELATPAGESWPGMIMVVDHQTLRLEKWIDELNVPLPELRSFVLPGGTELNAQLHVTRTICRRAERAILVLNEKETVSGELLKYVNRLSDLLFVMSRSHVHWKGVTENLWVPGGSRTS